MAKDTKVQMRPKPKTQPKESKDWSKLNPMKWGWLSKAIDFLAKSIAYFLLFLAAAYGIRRFLDAVPDWANVSMTTLLVLGMFYIIFKNRK